MHMVKCRLVMVCSDGSRCIMSDGEALELDDLRDTRDRVRLVTVSQAHGHLLRIALCLPSLLAQCMSSICCCHYLSDCSRVKACDVSRLISPLSFLLIGCSGLFTRSR